MTGIKTSQDQEVCAMEGCQNYQNTQFFFFFFFFGNNKQKYKNSNDDEDFNKF
jgi:hypothetical protein